MSLDISIAVVAAEASVREDGAALLRNAQFSDVETHGSPEGLDCDVALVCGAKRAQLIRDIQQGSSAGCVLALCTTEDCLEFLSVGADDIVLTSGTPEQTQLRVLLAYQHCLERVEFGEVLAFQKALLAMRTLVAERGDGVDVLREILLMASTLLGFERASMMAHVQPSNAAYVIAATDDPTLSRFQVSIADYPEVGEAIRTSDPLLIDDVFLHPSTERLAEDLEARGVRSLAVFPVSWKGRSMGALLFRKSSTGLDALGAHGRDFAVLLAAQLAAQLRDSSLFDRLRDQTRRLTRAGFEAERRAESLDSLNEYFEASSEGIFVVDQRNKVIYVNGTAETLTGFAKDALLGTYIGTLLPENQRETVAEVMDAVLEGSNIEPVDLDLKNTSGGYITVSLTTSTVLSKHGAVILSFRDVTQQRSLESQLQDSSEFLSNLIDSAVDAIIAVDMRGRVILFNQGAEQLFGYAADEVVHKIPVAKLYPDGVARQVMRMLRSQSYGGPGRLEQIRREVLTRAGECVPVNMTASVIYKNQREVATVGIFSDLRDRIRIEQRLLQAQEQLQEQEQRSMLAQLAGAAAHELNQPLTSIIGYAQLIQRTSELEAKHTRYTDTIVQEAERMAEIVKKIGRITHYETVAYVGSANIVDINRSVEASESAPVPAVIFEEDETTARISLKDIADSHEEEMRANAGSSVPQSQDTETEGH